MKEISDLGLIAALVTLGYAPLERKHDGKRVVFKFEDNPDTQGQLDQLCEDYFNQRLMVNAIGMHMTLKQIKSSIMQML